MFVCFTKIVKVRLSPRNTNFTRKNGYLFHQTNASHESTSDSIKMDWELCETTRAQFYNFFSLCGIPWMSRSLKLVWKIKNLVTIIIMSISKETDSKTSKWCQHFRHKQLSGEHCHWFKCSHWNMLKSHVKFHPGQLKTAWEINKNLFRLSSTETPPQTTPLPGRTENSSTHPLRHRPALNGTGFPTSTNHRCDTNDLGLTSDQLLHTVDHHLNPINHGPPSCDQTQPPPPHPLPPSHHPIFFPPFHLPSTTPASNSLMTPALNPLTLTAPAIGLLNSSFSTNNFAFCQPCDTQTRSRPWKRHEMVAVSNTYLLKVIKECGWKVCEQCSTSKLLPCHIDNWKQLITQIQFTHMD